MDVIELHDTRILGIKVIGENLQIDLKFVCLRLLNEEGTSFEDLPRRLGTLTLVQFSCDKMPIIGVISEGFINHKNGRFENLVPMNVRLLEDAEVSFSVEDVTSLIRCKSISFQFS